MKMPKEFYTLSDLAENRWKITEDDIFHLALAGEFSISVFWDGFFIEGEIKSPFELIKKPSQYLHDFVHLDIKDIRLFLVSKMSGENSVNILFPYKRDREKITLIRRPINFIPFSVVSLNTYHVNKPSKEGEGLSSNTVFSRSELVILSEEVEKYEDTNPHIIKNCQTGENIKNGQDIKNIDLLHKVLDPLEKWYSEPLAIAVTAWLALYCTKENNDDKEPGGNTEYVTDWLNENHPEITKHPTTTGHYCYIINPDKRRGPGKTRKQGGGSKKI